MTHRSVSLRGIARPGAIAIVDQGVTSAANFLTGVILARTLLPEGFGLYLLGFTVVILLLDLQTAVTTTPYMVFRPQLEDADGAAYLGSTLFSQLLLSSAATLLLAVVAAGVSVLGGSSGLASVIVALTLSVGLILLRDFIRKICFAHLEPKSALLVDGSVTVLQVGALLILAAFDLITVFRAFLAIGLAAGVVSLGWVLVHRRSIDVERGRLRSDIAGNLRFGKWPLMSGVVWALTMHAYPWLLTVFDGSSAAGIWAAGLGVVALANPLLLGLQNYLGPRIANDYAAGGAAELRRSVRLGSTALAITMGPVVAIVAVFGGGIVTLIYGDPFAGNGPLVALLMVNLLISSIAFAFSRGLFALEHADDDFRVNLVGFALMVTIGVGLAYRHGAIGAAVGLIVSNLVATLLRAMVFDRRSVRHHA